MKADKRILPVLAGLFLAVCLEGFHATLAAGSGYMERDRKLSLSVSQINEYAVSGDLYFPTGETPWMTFQSDQGIGCLELYFSEPLESDMDVQLYYLAEEGDAFDRFQGIYSYMIAGTEKARLQLPPGDFKNLRLDIRGGPFSLKKIDAWTFVPPAELTAGRIAARIDPFRLLITAVIAAVGFSAKAGQRAVGKRAQAQKRVLWLDAVRVLAAVFVITVHVLEPVLPMIPRGAMRLTAVGVVVATLSCNLLFFLLSGSLFLPFREESIGVFIGKRLMKVALPLLICSFFYIKLSCASIAPPALWLSYAARALFTGNIKAGPHLWLVYELLGAYLAAVPLRYMLKDMPERMEKQTACLILVLLGLRTAAVVLRESMGFTVFLDGWIGIFLMGYFMTRPWMRKYDRVWMISGVIALAASIRISEWRPDYKDIVCNRSIFMLCMACALFVSVMRLERFLKPFERLLSFFGRYSYMVLLVHMYVLYSILYNGWFNSAMPKLLQVALPLAACTAVSFLLAAAVDHTVLAAAMAAVGRFKKSTGSRRR